jgi:Holliday junction resolvasome RuvABC endonuclease subunit
MILGLDVSTSCTGWCLIDKNCKLVDIGFISLEKQKGVYSKAKMVEKELQNILVKHVVEKVFIEENLQAFRPGLSSAKTLSTLARFNGIVSLLSYQIFELEPVHINVNAARKSLGIKIERQSKCGKSTKEQVVEWTSSQLDSFEWPMKILKSGKRKGLEILDPVSYDMADAYVISRAGVVLEQ